MASKISHERMNAIPAGGWHQPVMVDAVLEHLQPRAGAVIVDGTAGTGGHSLAILPRLLPDGRLIALDRDPASVQAAAARLNEFDPLVTLIHENYRRLPGVLARLGLDTVDGVLLDLGMSSVQVDRPERGFSFSKDGPLDMRMDPTDETTAETLLNSLSAEELAELIGRLGEDRFAGRIARRITQERRRARITTTTQLARLIAAAVPGGTRRGRLHPATRTFQAIRIAVNDELGALEELLGHLKRLLAPGGRAVIITFHSLEDRLVKHAFLEGKREGCWSVVTPKPVRPTAQEVAENPRARSAKLRAVEKHA